MRRRKREEVGRNKFNALFHLSPFYKEVINKV
jgi:hypothetical protein